MLRPNLLLIEDDLNNQELVKISLEGTSLKHELIVVRDGEEALHYLFKEGKYTNRLKPDPALILLDLKLPKYNGFEVLAKIRGKSSTMHIPVVVFTSSREDSDIRECYKLGANGYVFKPAEYDDFNESVTSIGLFWLKFNSIINPP